MAVRRLNTIRRIEEVISEIYFNNRHNHRENSEDTCVKNILSNEGEELLINSIYNDDEEQDTICPILNTKFEKNQSITKLPCGHLFDKDSIYNWLSNEKAECPVCRNKLPSKELSVISKNDNNGSTEQESDIANALAYNNDLHLLRTAFRAAFQHLDDEEVNSSLNIIYDNVND